MQILMPDYYYKTIYDIDYDHLRTNGIECIIFDLDNTLAPYSQTKPEDKVLELICKLKQSGFKLAIVSNNRKERVRVYTDGMGLIHITPSANKPLRGAFLRAASAMQAKPSKISVIGDQIFTDVFGGNRAGMVTVLVDPIEKSGTILNLIKRLFEAPVIAILKRRRRG